jgi:hypothetical protein
MLTFSPSRVGHVVRPPARRIPKIPGKQRTRSKRRPLPAPHGTSIHGTLHRPPPQLTLHHRQPNERTPPTVGQLGLCALSVFQGVVYLEGVDGREQKASCAVYDFEVGDPLVGHSLLFVFRLVGRGEEGLLSGDQPRGGFVWTQVYSSVYTTQ